MSSSGSPPDASPASLARVVGLPGAVFLGLGSIVGTGVFVTLGIGAGIAGPSLLIAIVVAAVVATCNGLASAQLAAAHPVSGGAYEYGYRYLGPWAGRLAGVTFVCAKTASAATAALGLAAYGLALVRNGGETRQIILGVAAVVAVTLVVAGGMKRSQRLNAVVVVITLLGLGQFVGGALVTFQPERITFADADLGNIAHAAALVFVAFTGYGRIATLGEEVREPARTIPRAIVITLGIALALYLLVAFAALGLVGDYGFAAATRETSAPLERISEPAYRPGVAIAAVTAMLGVLLNLILGVSRVVLAMARRGDLPRGLAHVDRASPRRAVLVTGAAIAGLTLIGSVKTTWTVSAFTVLVYYGVMNLCALRQPPAERRFPRAVPAFGLVTCLVLAAWIVTQNVR